MSLINQALKEEQRRRNMSSAVPNAPMMSMAARRHRERGPIMLVGFSVLGLALAGATTAVVYFGSQVVGSNGNQLATAQTSEATAQAAQSEDYSNIPQSNGSSEKWINNLSQEQLATVQQMLLEKAEAAKQAAAPVSESTVEPKTEAPAPTTTEVTEEQIRNQGIVDQFSIQGIRKSGKDTRVFMNGRIQKLGDVVDLASGLSLIGFTESELVFQDPQGNRYSKPL